MMADPGDSVPASAAAESPAPPPDAGPVKFERWTWTLCTNANESAVELWRDDDHKLTIPLTPDQVEILMDKPITLFGILGGDGDD